jgi:hypothetical protein
MTNLSSPAQAVLDAANGKSSWGPDDILNDSRWIAAAAIRAVADQVVPSDPCGNDCCITECEQIRADFLAIAAELEGVND